MKVNCAETYRCPHSQAALTLHVEEIAGDEVMRGRLVCPEGHSFEIVEGIPSLLYPLRLQASDADFQQKYDRSAEQYEIGLEWLFRSFYEDQTAVRSKLIDLLNVRPGMRVLEVGCGTGKDSKLIAERLAGSGELFLSELSSAMLRICRATVPATGVSTEFLQANASYLPFPDGYFDAIFHFGGLNTFSELQRAFSEITRVGKRNATVVLGDEGISPWLREKKIGKILMNANPLYEHEVPLKYLPECARNVEVKWILGNAFYVIRYEIGEGPPSVDLDLPIPGKGDSLRIRFERRLPPPE